MPLKQYRIMVVIDARGSFGRDVLRGAMDFFRRVPQWLIQKDLAGGNETTWSTSGFDGILLAAPTTETLVAACRAVQKVVNVSTLNEPDLCPTVCVFNRRIGELAAQHFVGAGLRHLAFFGNPRTAFAVQRLEAFRSSCEALGRDCLPFPFPLRRGRLDWHLYWPCLQTWLRQLPKPVGLLASCDYEANMLAELCRELNIGVPEQIAIMGVDNDDMLCPMSRPPLSSVDPNARRVGFEAARLLKDLLDGGEPPAEPTLIEPLGVVTRQSTEVQAIGEPMLAEALRFIREHACDPVDVGAVASEVNVSVRTLSRRFRQVLGRSPHQEILRIRLERARELLLATDLKTHEVGRLCGFSHIQNFGQFFRKLAGSSPAAWRLRNHGRVQAGEA